MRNILIDQFNMWMKTVQSGCIAVRKTSGPLFCMVTGGVCNFKDCPIKLTEDRFEVKEEENMTKSPIVEKAVKQ